MHITYLSHKYVMHIHREMGQEKANVMERHAQTLEFFFGVFFSNPGLIFEPGELLNTRSVGLAGPTFPGSHSSSQQMKTINLLQMLV